MTQEAMKQALGALELCPAPVFLPDRNKREAAITALRTAIEQAEKQEGWVPREVLFVDGEPIAHREIEKPEPVALEAVYETIIHWDEGGGKRSRRELARRIVALYTTPPTPPAQQAQPEPAAWMHVQGNYQEPSLYQLDDDEIQRGWKQYPLIAAGNTGANK